MILDRFTSDLKSRAESQKKISKPNFDSFDKIVSFLRYINSLKEDDYQVFEGRLIDDIVIPQEFASFIIPKSVRIVPGDRKFVDLVVRDNVSKCPVTYEELMNEYDIFRGNYKRDSFSDMVTIGSVRVDKSLAEVLANVAIGDICHSEDNVIPVEICDVSDVITERYFNQGIDDVVKDYLVNLKFI